MKGVTLYVMVSVLFYVKVKNSMINVRTRFGRKFNFNCSEIEKVTCSDLWGGQALMVSSICFILCAKNEGGYNMFFFNKKEKKADKKYKWQPVVSDAQTILKLIEQCDDEAPGIDLIIKYNDIIYKIGISSDYSRRRGFFDKVYYINDKEYKIYQELKRATDIDYTPFELLPGTIYIIADELFGNPRSYTLLADK